MISKKKNLIIHRIVSGGYVMTIMKRLSQKTNIANWQKRNIRVDMSE